MIDWDQWRADYDSSSYGAQQEFYSKVWAKYPGQKRFNPATVDRFFADVAAWPDLNGRWETLSHD